MSDTKSTTESVCANCGAPLTGNYCAQCGQSIFGPNRFFLSLVNEAFENLFQLDSKAIRTLSQIIFRPGRVPMRYLQGKRASYVHPLRLYIVTSILFFFILSVLNFAEGLNEEVSQPIDSEVKESVRDFVEELNQEIEQSSGTAVAESVLDFVEELDQGLGESGDDTGAETLDSQSSSAPAVIIDLPAEDTLDLPFLEDEQNSRWTKFLREQAEKANQMALDGPSPLIGRFLEMAPILMFIILPIVALFLKIIFFRHPMFYAEHLIFVVYNHCFLFLMMSIMFIFDSVKIAVISPIIEVLVFIWVPTYLILALRRVYGLSAWGTGLSTVAILVFYNFVLGAGMVALMLIGLVTL
ncbi:MAG: DUF3667 domain-containing protein [Pseudomonadota bacterium]